MTSSEDNPTNDPTATADVVDATTSSNLDDSHLNADNVGLETVDTGERSVLPFQDLQAPTAADPTPPVGARFLAFASILIGGLLGALIGYGTADLMAESSIIAALGAVIGAASGALGVGIVAALTLRAMNEWEVAQHPEDERTIADHLGQDSPPASKS